MLWSNSMVLPYSGSLASWGYYLVNIIILVPLYIILIPLNNLWDYYYLEDYSGNIPSLYLQACLQLLLFFKPRIINVIFLTSLRLKTTYSHANFLGNYQNEMCHWQPISKLWHLLKTRKINRSNLCLGIQIYKVYTEALGHAMQIFSLVFSLIISGSTAEKNTKFVEKSIRRLS